MSGRHDNPQGDGDTAARALRITTVATGSAIICRLEGEIDLDQRPKLENALVQAVNGRPARLLVDLAGVGFCDSAGLNALLVTRADAETAGIRLILTAPPPQIRRLLEITGTNELFTVRDSVRAALDGDDPRHRGRT
ncbi:STAS domain-containing protein [Kitasatospora sp. NPDC004240]